MIQNQLKGYLKEKYHGLAPQLTRKDKNKTGKINFEDFVSVLNNMDVPLALSSEKSWTRLFLESAEKNALDYKGFLKKLEMFEPQEIQHDSPVNEEEVRGFSETVKSPQLMSQAPDPLATLNILNRQKVPVNQLDNFFLRARKIRLFLRDNIKSEPELMEELKQRTKKSVISLTELKDYVIDKLQEKKTMKITKKELEGFLSSYIYNKDGVTPIDEVAKNIFMEDTKASFELHKFKRAIPPIREGHEFNPEESAGVKRILKSIEEKFFDQGSQKANEIFKKFDRDRDGFITEEDLEKALVINQIVHQPFEVKQLMAFLDTNHNGFVTYKEFNEKIRANILVVNHDRLLENPEKFALSHQPSLEFLKTQQGKIGYFGKVQQELVNEFKPDDKIIQFISNTRYGAKPPHQNTFVNFECEKGKIDVPKKFEPFNIGAEEKERKLRGDVLRVEALKKSRDDRAVRLKVIEDNVILKDQGKIFMRALSKEEYEKRCKLSSPFANMSIE
jgi:Ca2+-binding EF-hand superfamily protein